MGRYISNTNSYQDNELLLLKQGIAKNRKEFLTAGANTWTIDHDVIARVRVWGGGGGGGGGITYNYGGDQKNRVPGAGGGAGGAAEAILRLSAGTYNIVVGDGGTAGTNGGGVVGDATGSGSGSGGNGGRGGTSSFHNYITCFGGSGGCGGTSKSIISGGYGGYALFGLSSFNGFLYTDCRIGGVGGSLKTGFYTRESSSTAESAYRFCQGSEGGAGESGGPARYTSPSAPTARVPYFSGGGGGGYNPPFIYGVIDNLRANSGRGVGSGGAGSEFGGAGFAGNSGAVVIEWN